MDRALSFGAVADLYDRVRPTYPDLLIDDIVALLPGPDVLEVGAGTGKATAKLVSRGLHVTCLEPDPEMARALATKRPDRILVSTFEGWTPDSTYHGVLSAQAWHWTDPASRLDRAAAALRPGGLLALFWNTGNWGNRSEQERIAEVYRSHGIAPVDRPVYDDPAFNRAQQAELGSHPAFEPLVSRRYPWQQVWSGDDLVAYFNTTSHHRVLSEATRDSVSAGIRAAIGDEIEMDWRTELFLARRR